MKGATPDVVAKTNSKAKSNNTVTIGMSQYNLRAHKKRINSPAMPKFVTIPRRKFLILNLLIALRVEKPGFELKLENLVS
jgi:hypothetical protein